ncbi:unnamed protein product [Bursaphelenchus okinawaensis]|uniref:Histone-lysine N-methyltransferase n=1 Tax=Bursaphelenchus okinawaensis TaxID=465554 RepID=A0A811JVB5_9BILA|nr:unnamed protein product [Bursaphelenchus okinawaensis]CAG9084230.1 unnamed protein product [Bursaphelenchus okinawaensis]
MIIGNRIRVEHYFMVLPEDSAEDSAEEAIPQKATATRQPIPRLSKVKSKFDENRAVKSEPDAKEPVSTAGEPEVEIEGAEREAEESEDDEKFDPRGLHHVTSYPEREYDVEKVLTMQHYNGRTWYLVKWSGYPYNMASWSTITEIGADSYVLEMFQRRLVICKAIFHMAMDEQERRKEFIKEKKISIRRATANERYLCYQAPYFPLINHPQINYVALYACHQWENEMNVQNIAHGISPVYVENWVDFEAKPPNFTFTWKSIYHVSSEKVIGAGQLNPAFFSCTQRKHCCKNFLERQRVIHPAFYEDTLYECSEMCKCGPSCRNRETQKGRQVPLVIFRTVESGWSVRAAVDMPRGTFVAEYLGEIITPEEMRRRKSHRYMFDIYFEDGVTRAKKREAVEEVMDQARAGEEEDDDGESDLVIGDENIEMTDLGSVTGSEEDLADEQGGIKSRIHKIKLQKDQFQFYGGRSESTDSPDLPDIIELSSNDSGDSDGTINIGTTSEGSSDEDEGDNVDAVNENGDFLSTTDDSLDIIEMPSPDSIDLMCTSKEIQKSNIELPEVDAITEGIQRISHRSPFKRRRLSSSTSMKHTPTKGTLSMSGARNREDGDTPNTKGDHTYKCNNVADPDLCIDAERIGNEARFFNNSCDPNMVAYKVYSNPFDFRLYRICLFTSRDVKRGEELTFSYYVGKLDQLQNATWTDHCLCMYKDCIGQIG